MKQTVFYPALSAILSGVILALIGTYIFSTSPLDLTHNVSIRFYKTELRDRVIKDIVNLFSPGTDFEDSGNARKLFDNFGYGDDLTFLIYDIENFGDHEIPDLQINIGKFRRAYLFSNQSFEAVSATKSKVQINLLPRNTARLVVVADYYLFEPTERFMVNGKEVPILSMFEERSPVTNSYSIVVEYFAVIVVLAVVGVFSLFLLLMALFTFIFTRNNPIYLAKSTENWTLVRDLTILNVIRTESPERFKIIVEQSERLYTRWMKVKKVAEKVAD